MAEFDSAIPPGGTGRVVAKVDTKKIEGRRTKSVNVRTNDPERPELVLRIVFESRPPILVLPQRLVRLQAVQGGSAERFVLLRRDDDVPLGIESAEAAGELLAVEILDPGRSEDLAALPPEIVALEPGPGDRVLKISVAQSANPATERSKAVIATDDPRSPQVEVPVYVSVLPLVRSIPASVHLEPTEASPHEVYVSLSHSRRRAFRLQSVRVEGGLDGVTAEIVGARGPVQRVRLHATAGAGDGVAHGTLVAETGLARLPEIRVPVAVRRAPAGTTSAP